MTDPTVVIAAAIKFPVALLRAAGVPTVAYDADQDAQEFAEVVMEALESGGYEVRRKASASDEKGMPDAEA